MVHRLAPAALLIFLMGSITLGAPQGEFRIAGQKGAEGWAALGEQANGDLLVDRVVSGTRLRGVLRASNGTWSGRLVRSGGASGALAASGSAHTFDLILTPRQGSDRDLDADWVERQSPTKILRGRARWQRVSESSTLGSSPLMASVTRNALRTASKGNVPRELMLTKAGNQVDPQLLIEGPQIFARAAAMIEAAEEEVLIQTFHWAPSKAADTIMAGLKALEVRRRAAGATTPVRVRFVVDRNRILKALRHTERDLKANLRATGLDSRFVQAEVESHTHWLYGALHSKLFVIDGRHAMITGANVNDWAEAPKTWYELGLVVHGPVVEGLRAEFAQLWNKKHKSPLAALQTAPLPASGPGVPVLITSRKSRGNVFQDNDDNPASQSYFALLRSAQSHVRILTPHLNDDDVRRELIACLRRGVRVELVLSKGFGLARAKLPFQGGNNTKNLGRLYRRLKNHPAALARFQVRWFSRDGQSPISTEENNSHAKYMTCDDRVAIIGCSNLDEQSFNHSREVNLVIEDATLTQGFDQQAFLPVYSRSIPVDLSALK